MADENGMTENTDQNSSEGGIIINILQMQSIDIPQRFNRVKTDNGWIINVLEPGRITINFITSMRKLDTALLAGDSIERDGEDIIIIRNQPADAYRTQRSTSSLVRTRNELLANVTPGVGGNPVEN